jgi:hypothetical protein
MTCAICRDHGIVGGDISGRFAGPARWCTCPAALERQNSDPFALDVFNEAREKLIARFTPLGKAKVKFAVPNQEAYFGDF